jgi:hypothetical protein
MIFQPYGPFHVKRSDGHIDRSKEAKRAFWDGANEACFNISSGCGCYVFAIQTRRGVIPWYVGKAERQGFDMEIFTPHKLLLYNEALRQQGVPVIFLLTKMTPGGKLCRPAQSNDRSIRFLESNLIGIALRKNRHLKNLKDTKLVREISVPGILNSSAGRPHTVASDLKDALGLS